MTAASGVPDDLAEVVLRVGRAYGMTADRDVYQAVAVKDGRLPTARELDAASNRHPIFVKRGGARRGGWARLVPCRAAAGFRRGRADEACSQPIVSGR